MRGRARRPVLEPSVRARKVVHVAAVDERLRREGWMVGASSGRAGFASATGSRARTNGLSETTRMGGRGSATRRPTIAGDERHTHHALLARRLHAHATLRHDEPDRAGAPPSPTPARRSNCFATAGGSVIPSSTSAAVLSGSSCRECYARARLRRLTDARAIFTPRALRRSSLNPTPPKPKP